MVPRRGSVRDVIASSPVLSKGHEHFVLKDLGGPHRASPEALLQRHLVYCVRYVAIGLEAAAFVRPTLRVKSVYVLRREVARTKVSGTRLHAFGALESEPARHPN